MNVNGYLTRLSNKIILSKDERNNIIISKDTLKKRLRNSFGSEIKTQMVFGSYSRETILPRKIDENSDIDYMILFNDNSYKPQTYLNKLRNFAENYYSTSEIYQSSPTIVLSLNHIKFELVPAVNNWIGNILIPAKQADLDDWIFTNPKEFNSELSEKNQDHNNLIIPLIRLIKYWNVLYNRPFDSYEIEKDIVNTIFPILYFGGGNIKDYFLSYLSRLPQMSEPAWKNKIINNSRNFADEIKDHIEENEEQEALRKIKRLIPDFN